MPGHRRHPDAFKRELCHQLRSGLIGRREAQRRYALSDNLIQTWLSRYDGGRPRQETPGRANRSLHATCEMRIALLERKVGQLTVALEAATDERSDRLSSGPTPSRRLSLASPRQPRRLRSQS